MTPAEPPATASRPDIQVADGPGLGPGQRGRGPAMPSHVQRPPDTHLLRTLASHPDRRTHWMRITSPLASGDSDGQGPSAGQTRCLAGRAVSGKRVSEWRLWSRGQFSQLSFSPVHTTGWKQRAADPGLASVPWRAGRTCDDGPPEATGAPQMELVPSPT